MNDSGVLVSHCHKVFLFFRWWNVPNGSVGISGCALMFNIFFCNLVCSTGSLKQSKKGPCNGISSHVILFYVKIYENYGVCKGTFYMHAVMHICGYWYIIYVYEFILYICYNNTLIHLWLLCVFANLCTYKMKNIN